MSNIKSTDKYTEDEIRKLSGEILEFEDTDKAKSGVGQLTTFNMLGFAKVNGKAINDKPDGWYLPYEWIHGWLVEEAKR